MKRKSIVCAVLALALILMGTGYAYWGDVLNITTKATTGDMDVTFVDLGLYAQYNNEVLNVGGWSIIDGIGTGYVAEEFFMRSETDYNVIARDGSLDDYAARAAGYHSVEFDAELIDAAPITATVGPYNPGNANGSDNIVITIDNIYPGYAQAFRTDILNVGNIATKLTNIKFETSRIKGVGMTEELMNLLGVAFMIDGEYYNGDSEDGVDVFKLCTTLGTSTVLDANDDFFTVGGVDFVRLSALAEIDPASFQEAITDANILLAPSDGNENRMDLYIGIAMDPDAEGTYTAGSGETMLERGQLAKDAKSQGKGAQLSIDLLWEQFNVGVPSDANPNWLKNQNK